MKPLRSGRSPRDWAHATWGWACGAHGHCQGCDDNTKSIRAAIKADRARRVKKATVRR